MMIEQLTRMLRRYHVSFSIDIRHGYGTSLTEPHYTATVVAENNARKLTADAWDKTEVLAVDTAFTRLVKQIEALDNIEY